MVLLQTNYFGRSQRYQIYLTTGQQTVINYPGSTFRLVSLNSLALLARQGDLQVTFYTANGAVYQSRLFTPDYLSFRSNESRVYFDRVEITNLNAASITAIIEISDCQVDRTGNLFPVFNQTTQSKTLSGSVLIYDGYASSELDLTSVKRLQLNAINYVKNAATWGYLSILWRISAAAYIPMGYLNFVNDGDGGNLIVDCDINFAKVNASSGQILIGSSSSNGLATVDYSLQMYGE